MSIKDSMVNAFDILTDNSLALKLEAISIRELFYIGNAPCNVYVYEKQKFKPILTFGKMIDVQLLKDLLKNNMLKIFVLKVERYKIIETHQQVLTKLTRSLSMGVNISNVKKQFNVLTSFDLSSGTVYKK